ncbi:MAG: hypothetical protein ACXAB7_24840, partial [Candidatus Kariarchaeaceae archaeon]
TKSTRKKMSDTSISTWLARIQRDKSDRERWTSMDFRKRALLQHYWVTRDLTAIARFGGYKRPESALNLISEILSDQGVDSIDALASLPEFAALKGDSKKLATIGEEDQLTLTIQLDREEMDIIRNSGLTPTQAVRSIISLKDLYGAFSPSGAPVGGASSTASPSLGGSGPQAAQPGDKPKIAMPTLADPSKGPSLGGPAPSLGGSSGPSLSGPSLGGPAPSGPSGPGTSGPGGPSTDAGLTANILDVQLKSTPIDDMKPAPSSAQGSGGGAPGGGGGPMDQLGELKAILAARRAKSDEAPEKSSMPERPSLGGKIVDSDEPSDSIDDTDETDEEEDEYIETDEEEEISDVPTFEF